MAEVKVESKVLMLILENPCTPIDELSSEERGVVLKLVELGYVKLGAFVNGERLAEVLSMVPRGPKVLNGLNCALVSMVPAAMASIPLAYLMAVAISMGQWAVALFFALTNVALAYGVYRLALRRCIGVYLTIQSLLLKLRRPARGPRGRCLPR